jgi:hypothetical protein
MKKKLLVACIVSFICNIKILSAQDKKLINIPNDTTITRKCCGEVLKVPFFVTCKNKIDTKLQIIAKASPNQTSIKYNEVMGYGDFSIRVDTVEFLPSDWDHKAKDATVVKQIIIEIMSDDSTMMDKSLLIFFSQIIKNDSVHFIRDSFRINILKTTESLNSGGVRLSVGTNLDFKDGIVANSFYGRLSFFKQFATSTNDIPRILLNNSKYITVNGINCLINHLGLYTGVYQNRFITTENSSQVEVYHPLKYLNSDTLNARKISGTQRTKSSITNYGVFMTLPYTWLRNKNEQSSISFTASFVNAEIILQMVAEEYTYSDTNSINVKIRSEYLNSNNLKPKYDLDKQSKTFYREESYLSFTNFGYTYINKYIHLFFSAEPFGYHYSSNSGNWSKYFKFYLTVTETKLGLRIGADFRGDYLSYPSQQVHANKTG